MNLGRKMVLAATVAAAVGTAGTANAALLQLSGGTAFSTPATNNVLGSGWTMRDDAILSTTTANVRLTFHFLGSESGFKNQLVTEFGTHTETDTAPGYFLGFPGPLITATTGTSTGSATGVQAAAGQVKLEFVTPSIGTTVQGTGNPVGRSIAFAFVSDVCGPHAAGATGRATFKTACQLFDGVATSSLSNTVLFALDDSGAGPDDNHDDYVGYVVATPLPAAAWLFGSAVLGFLGLARRKSSAQVV